jgi:hypothetical protein
MEDTTGYEEFIVADNDVVKETTEEVATPPENETDVAENETDIEVEATEEHKQTETQRVSQRINEAKQQGIDSHIAKQGYVWNNQPITTEAQYNQAVEEQAEQQRNAELEEKGIDPKHLNDAVESNPTVRAAKELLANNSIKEAEQKMYNDFTSKFPDTKAEDIKPETWKEVDEGSSLVDAYTRQENKDLKAKLKVYEQNKSNKSKAPMGQGISTHGSDEVASEDDFMRGFNSI